MGDWDKYAVTEVRYWDDEDDRVKHVKRRGIDVENERVGEPGIARRRGVLLDLRSDEDYLAAVEKDGKLKIRDEIDVVEVGGTEYLRVDGDDEAEDYLGGLPTF